MTVCSNIGPKKRILCTGDLKTPITIQVRTLTPKTFNDPDYNEVFTETKVVFAAVETKRGHSSFNDIGITVTGTILNFSHQFYIRYNPEFTVTSEDWVEYKNIKYDIQSVENLEENNGFLILFCLKKGIKTRNANLT